MNFLDVVAPDTPITPVESTNYVVPAVIIGIAIVVVVAVLVTAVVIRKKK
jgi:hypothetical protein